MVASAAELQALVRNLPLASTLYVWVLKPCVPGAPAFPLAAFTHDNSNATFSTDTVCAVWKRLWRAAAALNLHLMLHAADGDSRVRAAAFQLFLVQSVGERETLRVDHPLVKMCMLKVGPGPLDFVSFACDYLHIGWRLRLQFIHPERVLQIGPFMANWRWLLEISKSNGGHQVDLGLRYNYVSCADKQNWPATLWLADLRLERPERGAAPVVTPVSTLRDAMLREPAYWGAYLLIDFLHHYLRIFVVKGRSPAECVRDAAFCIAFVSWWHHSLSSGMLGKRPDGQPKVRRVGDVSALCAGLQRCACSLPFSHSAVDMT
eukprot:scaffold23.g4122.t1